MGKSWKKKYLYSAGEDWCIGDLSSVLQSTSRSQSCVKISLPMVFITSMILWPTYKNWTYLWVHLLTCWGLRFIYDICVKENICNWVSSDVQFLRFQCWFAISPTAWSLNPKLGAKDFQRREQCERWRAWREKYSCWLDGADGKI